jgi:hypothetical protein
MAQKYSYICDYYVLFDTKSEFIYIAETVVEAMSLSKSFLTEEIMPKYPAIFQ